MLLKTRMYFVLKVEFHTRLCLICINTVHIVYRTELETGTYGNRALREIPKPKRGRGRRGRGRGGSTSHTPRRPQAPPSIPEEGGTPGGAYAAPAHASSKPRYAWPGMQNAYSTGGSTAGSAYQSHQSGPPSRRGGHYQPAPVDSRRYAPRTDKMTVAGATYGAKGDSYT